MSLSARAVRVIAAVALTCAATITPGPALAWSGGPGASVPAGFEANSVTWLSAQRGWVLGAAACGKNACAEVIGTTDAAKTWRLIGTVGAPIAEFGGRPGITEIRFANPAVGWAFGPYLFSTSTGGKSWTRMPIPGGGKQVLALAAGPTQTYAVVTGCAWGAGICPRPLSFWRIPTGGRGGWTRIPLGLPPNDGADVAVFGATVYVLDEQVQFGRPDVFDASTDGRHFTARPAPCNHAKDLALIQAVPMSATRVALFCVGNAGSPAPGDATKSVYTSANTGTTDTYAGATGPAGTAAQLAASPSGNLAVAALSAGSFLYINDTHKQAWTMVKDLGVSAGWNDITYVTNSQAWVVYRPADLRGTGQLWTTHDAGLHWSITKL
jgi:hypothetical protein